MDPAVIFGLQSKGRNLQTDTFGPFIYELTLSMDRYQAAKSPADYVALLDARMDILQAYLPAIHPNTTIATTVKELAISAPDWTQTVSYSNATLDKVTITAAIDSAGQIYGIALPVSFPQPLAQQIALGYDSYNVKLPPGAYVVQPCLYKTPTDLLFFGLSTGVEYNIWLIAENDLPVTPTLMKDSRVQRVKFRSGEVDTTRDVLVMLEDDWACILMLAEAWLIY